MSIRTRSADVVIVGAGPSGLTAAAELARSRSVLVLDRESDPGGIPRHSNHTGYGLRDLRRVVTGPRYAAELTSRALRAGAQVMTNAMVTGWSGERALAVTTPSGLVVIDAGAVVLATGARERPRAARLVAGSRPRGVYTTGELQQDVHLRHRRISGRAVVVGSELVSWSAVLTLREAGCATALMTTVEPRAESPRGVAAVRRAALRVPVATRTRVVRVLGRDTVLGVEVERLDAGLIEVVPCDVVVFTADWVPDHELARLRSLALDPGTRGPQVDSGLQTDAPGVFAIGNLVHPVDTADVAALDGRHVAGRVALFLDGGDRAQRPGRPDRVGGAPGSAARPGVALVAGEGFGWVAPNWLAPGAGPAARGHLLLWPLTSARKGRVVLRQGGQVVAETRTTWPRAPGRVARVPWSVLDTADPSAGAVVVSPS